MAFSTWPTVQYSPSLRKNTVCAGRTLVSESALIAERNTHAKPARVANLGGARWVSAAEGSCGPTCLDYGGPEGGRQSPETLLARALSLIRS